MLENMLFRMRYLFGNSCAKWKVARDSFSIKKQKLKVASSFLTALGIREQKIFLACV